MADKPKHPGGRPTLYSEQMLIEAQKYIDNCEDEEVSIVSIQGENYTKYETRFKVKLPSLEGLALHLQITRSTLYQWKERHKEFSDIIETLLQKQAEKLLNNGLAGSYNSTISKVILTKHGYTDKQEIDQKTEHSGSVNHTIDYTKLSDAALREIAALNRPEESKD